MKQVFPASMIGSAVTAHNRSLPRERKNLGKLTGVFLMALAPAHTQHSRYGIAKTFPYCLEEASERIDLHCFPNLRIFATGILGQHLDNLFPAPVASGALGELSKVQRTETSRNAVPHKPRVVIDHEEIDILLCERTARR